MDKFRLIAEVKQNPYLWRRQKGKRCFGKTGYLWIKIAKNLGADVNACKNKWTQLRHFYGDEKKRVEKRIKMGIYSNRRSKWKFFESLTFLDENDDIEDNCSLSEFRENVLSSSDTSTNLGGLQNEQSICVKEEPQLQTSVDVPCIKIDPDERISPEQNEQLSNTDSICIKEEPEIPTSTQCHSGNVKNDSNTGSQHFSSDDEAGSVISSLNEGDTKFRLIAEVEKAPYLWKRLKGKRSFDKRDYLWMNIAKTVGADANVCKTTWRQLRNFYGDESKRLKKRKTMKSKWQFFESLKFLETKEEFYEDIEDPCSKKESEISISSTGNSAKTKKDPNNESLHFSPDDETESAISSLNEAEGKFRLIAEVKKIPYVWRRQKQKKSHGKIGYLWIKIAQNLGADVNACKDTWAQLRNFYNDEKKRAEKRKQMGTSSSNHHSKWKFFESLRFLDANDDLADTADYCTNPGGLQNEQSVCVKESPQFQTSSYQYDSNIMDVTCIKTEPEERITSQHDEPLSNMGSLFIKEEPEIRTSSQDSENANKDPDKESQDFSSDDEAKSLLSSLKDGDAKFSLIAEVKKRPYLWRRQKEKRSYGKTRYLWMDVAKRIGAHAQVCKSTWRQLRSCYCDEKKRMEKSNKVQSTWKFFESLKFLDTNEEANDDIEDNYSSSDCQKNVLSITDACATKEPEIQTSCTQIAENANKDDKDSQHFSSDDEREPVMCSLNEGDAKFRLIAEVEKRPYLWRRQKQKKNVGKTSYFWMSVAKSVGADAHVCKATWRQMRNCYSEEKKRVDKGIKTKSKWKFYDAMKFLDGSEEVKDDIEDDYSSDCQKNIASKTDAREKEEEVDIKLRLIAEVKKSPYLWRPQNEKGRYGKRDYLWTNIAKSVGIDAKVCRSTWRQLRSFYGDEKKRLEKGKKTKWKFFDSLKFIDDNEEASDDIEDNYSQKNVVVNTNPSKKEEAEVRINSTRNLRNDSEYTDKASENISSVNEAESVVISINEGNGNMFTGSKKVFEETKELWQPQSEEFLLVSSSSQNKKFKRQARVSDDTKNKDDTFSNYEVRDAKYSIDYPEDTDYSFLLTCLPPMKMMTTLQNLEFRAKVTDLISNTLSNNDNS